MENGKFRCMPADPSVLTESKERIERLFDVTIDVQKIENDCRQSGCDCSRSYICNTDCICKVSNLINDDSQSVDKKCMGVVSVSEEGFCLHTNKHDVVNQVLQHKDGIDEFTATLVLASTGSVNVKGQEYCVTESKKLFENTDPFCENVNDADMKQLETRACDPAIIVSNSKTGNLTVDNQHRNSVECSLEKFGTNINSIGYEECKKLRDMNNHDSVADKKVTELQNDCKSSSEDESLVREILKDPEYNCKVEFALKLGYEEADLIEVFKKLSPQAHQNDILSELIKLSSTKPVIDTQGMNDQEYSGQGDSLLRKAQVDLSSPFRHIVIDGSNVAMSHGNKEQFSCQGIKLAVDWFRERGHTNITVFVPQWRKETSRSDTRIRDQSILNELEKEKMLVFTPSRRIGGKRVVCYDDRYILKLALETDGIVVSNDNYRDLIAENDQFKKVVEERLLMFSFVNNRFMPPDDPLGRNGPTLDNFLLKQPATPEPLPPPCPYGSKKCTYGNKCKYYHPERRSQPLKTVHEKLAEQTKLKMLEMRLREAQQPADGKRKPTPKTQLYRAKLVNSSEPGSTASDCDSSPSVLSSGKKVEMQDEYNQRLAEGLLKLQQDRKALEQEKGKNILPRTSEKKEQQPITKSLDQQLNRSSLIRMDLLQQGRSLPGSPRESSPVNNLAVPGQTDSYDDGNKFVSGHLLLAKKLSDEADESDKLKMKNLKRLDDIKHSPISKAQPSKTADLTKNTSKKQLSRQLSLQGGEDPRLNSGHQGLHAQLSYDPRRLTQKPHAPFSNPEKMQQMMRDFMHSQRRDVSEEDGTINKSHQSNVQDTSHSHSTLARMQSAPDQFLPSQHLSGQFPLMDRQNSCSDTQLNKIHDSAEHDNHDGMLHRDSSKPMKDTSGSVTFQIGGPMASPVSQYNPVKVPSANYALTSLHVSSTGFHKPISPDFLHPGHMPYIVSNPIMPPPYHRPYNVPHPSGFYQPHTTPFAEPYGIWDAPHSAGIASSNFLPQYRVHAPDCNPLGFFPQNMPSNDASLEQYHQEVVIVNPNDQRLKLYHDLCRLFPEDEVKMAMTQHPDVDNPKDLCTYLLAANK